MQNRIYIKNAKRLNITVTCYLILDYMHYNEIHLNYYYPKGIGYIGLSEKLFKNNVKILVEKKYLKQHKSEAKGDVTLTAAVKTRLNKMVGNKKTIETLFENQFWKIYPNQTAKKNALASWMNLPINDESNVVQDIIDAIEARKKWIEDAPPKSFISEWPMPATYLNAERWKDVLTPWPFVPKEQKNEIKYVPKGEEKL